MKSLSIILNTILVCVLVFLVSSAGLPTQTVSAAGSNPAPSLDQNSCSTGRSIQVSGTAVVNVTPDRVLIQLGVQSNGRTPQLTEAVNSATVFRVIQAVKKQNVAEKDIITDRYVIEPIYEDYDSLSIKGYRIYNMVAITLRDINQVNEVLIAALNAGANQVVNVEFYLSDLRKYRDQARELAVIAASEKAQDLASAAGAKAGCVLSISENTWSYFSGGYWGRNNNLWTQNTVQNIPSGNSSGDSSEFGPVNLGQISVRAEVSASYALK
ncbi:MAG: SIMPL domain-containing protein [Anaerolineales bacterium]|nr:SIMPL domain-containing protein [Anaerolineales bacterium]